MTNISSNQTDFDFWEFVSCAKCQLSFSLDAGAAVPFWLTQCGHVICNNHLNPDQSCSQCGSQNIQLIPLQREMDTPMSEWFRSLPMSLDVMAFTAKFQQDTMASQIRYFKTRYQQLRHVVERLKRDVAEHKKSNTILQSENDQFRMQMDRRNDDQIPSNTFNLNGKRQMSTRQFDFNDRRPMTNSSPHSIPTPLGPDRLTLAPGRQQLPELSSRGQHYPGPSRSQVYEQENQDQGHFVSARQQRPASGRSLEQYAYVPTDAPKFQVQQLSYPHANPKNITNQLQSEVPQHGRNQGQPAILPATPRFTPTLGSKEQFPVPSQGHGFPRQTKMGPPPTPQRFHPHNNTTDKILPPSSRHSRQKLQNSDPTIPIQSISHHPLPNAPSQRFFQSSTSNPRELSLRPSAPNTAREHRMSFVPGAAGKQGFV